MKTIAIIRDRGQLTIPDSIRQVVNWVTPSSVVSISLIKANEIVIKPHSQVIDEEKIWQMVKASRAIKGKGKGNAADFIEKDRQTHSL